VDCLKSGAVAVVPVLPVVDTLQQVSAQMDVTLLQPLIAHSYVACRLRKDLHIQCFKKFIRAPRMQQMIRTLALNAGHKVQTVIGEERALKITTPSQI
jgi:2-C-methyl-D-erythritol 4-phosphate cytidylyltransferase / 2-C-methyl-D-erythritol 2,4-cyclodiphosphate synthase